ncbi:MAG: transketolase [Saprospirales bacterium]|nr:MAG: transketolase [Saprospirales bacterium]
MTALLDSWKVSENVENSDFINEVIYDYWICCISREASLLGRKEVLTGKAKFGILGDGKEVPQIAMAKVFKKGDFRSGYYRDQTFMFALGLCKVEDYFAQLYSDPDNDPFSAGRQMNSHFATRMIDENDNWLDHTELYNVSSDISPTAGQMARAFGLACASKKYRNSDDLGHLSHLSNKGNEVVFCTIGDASTSEGIFWEVMNAATVERVPLVVSVWDDGYGISVPKKYQTANGSISRALSGFASESNEEGMDIYKVKAYDYPALCEVYEKAIDKSRQLHRPALIHVEDCTQPQGHSTSGSHERYKSKERLQWEQDYDCIVRMGKWMVENGIATEEKLAEISAEAKAFTRNAMKEAWKNFASPVKSKERELLEIFNSIVAEHNQLPETSELQKELSTLFNPLRYELLKIARKMSNLCSGLNSQSVDNLREWILKERDLGKSRYQTHLYSASEKSALRVPIVPAEFPEEPKMVNGYEILNKFFDTALMREPALFAFGEDVGKIGDVNQGLAGMQEKYGEHRVFDVGIREWSIVGQALGMAMRGLRPIAEIQYLDYLMYGLTPLTDDAATLRYRSFGMQMAPLIIRTRGHRLEGIWHTGSPIGMMIHALRGIYVLMPRNMTQAAGMYNTMLRSVDPAIIVECLNGYRLKEPMPTNLTEFTVPLGVPEVLSEGSDVTLVTYGSCVRIAEDAIAQLANLGISVELIDVQTLVPFDLEHNIVESLKKTNRVVFLDEDVPGGATSYMMQKVLEEQGGYFYLDSKPLTICATENRSPYGSDGDYFCKPSAEDIVEEIYLMMKEADPEAFPGQPEGIIR